MSETAVWQWGLEPELLDLAEAYLGLPVWYYGADVRKEVADGIVRDVRQWHRDAEDRRVLKLLVWLSVVDDESGPLAYLTLDQTALVSDRLRYVSGFLSDARVAEFVSPELWTRAVGPIHHSTLLDTARLFHRATPPLSTDRYSVTLTWTARHPRMFQTVPGTTAENARGALEGLDVRQRDALAPQWSRLLDTPRR